MADLQTVFISYSHEDREFVQRVCTDLERAGISVWIDQKDLKVGTPDWEQLIRSTIRHSYAVLLVASPYSRESRYVRDELLIAEMYQRHVVAIWARGEQWAECVRMGWIGTHYADARDKRYDEALLQTIQVLREFQSTSIPSPTIPVSPVGAMFEPRNPYKGLRPFTSADTQDFFGRENLIKEILESVSTAEVESRELPVHRSSNTARLLAVVGPSGSGKSSVVMAGLLPRLQSGALAGSDQWVYLDPVLPGSQPLESLAVVLAEALKTSVSTVLDDLDHSARGLHLLGRKLAKGRDSLIVLLVDQFEELFTLTSETDKRDHFIDLLITAATEPDGRVFVILTLRADFYDRPMNYASLSKLLETRTKHVPPLSLEDLRDVIEKPSALPDVQLEFEPGLVGDLLFEVRGQVGALPLLQFTLDQLVEHRRGRRLTRVAYDGLGGVRGALAMHAEAIYSRLPTEIHRQMARGLFLRLIEPGEMEQDATRRRISQRELILSDPEQTEVLWEVSEAFVKTRLLTTNYDYSGLATIEVSHEALIRKWDRLSDWLRTARDDVQLQQIISRDTREWFKQGKRDDDLYRGVKLKEAQEWANRALVSIEEQEFIETALAMEREMLSRVAENEKLLKTVQLSNEQLREIDRVKSDFLANMSHELRTPLNSVIGFSRVILKGIDGPLTDMQEQDLTTIYDSGTHLLRLINDILDHDKIAAGKMDVSPQYFDITTVIEEVRSIATGLILDKPISIRVGVAPNLSRVYADEFRTKQILLELMSNASKFTAEGYITIAANMMQDEETGHAMVRIDVSDTGIGLADKDIPLLFEPYRQVDSSLARAVGGTGLGLSIAKGLVELQGGKIFVSSELNVGSTFSVTLPTEII